MPRLPKPEPISIGLCVLTAAYFTAQLARMFWL
jgi:hypothetical protein